MFTALGLAFCFAMFLCFFLLGPSAAGANEILRPVPQLTDGEGKPNDRFLGELANYYGDHFHFRQELINTHAKINAAVFSVSTAEDVILGREGWLYYGSTLADYTGTKHLTDAELDAAVNNLLLLQEYCTQEGMDFVFAPVPNKNTLYGENMPSLGVRSEEHDLDRLMAKLRAAGVNTADLYAAFSANDEVLYFAHDSHWTDRGAALGADVITAALGRPTSFFAGEFVQGERHSGDLYEMLYPGSADPERDMVHSVPLAFDYAPNSGTRPDSINIRTQSEGTGTLVAFRDSFGNNLYPYLAACFAQASFSRSVNYNMTMASALHADAVLVELVERNIDYLIRNIPVMPAPLHRIGDADSSGDIRLQGERAEGTLPGHILWQGAAPEADADSPLYVLTEEGAFACFRLRNGAFAAYIPERINATGVAFYKDGRLTALSAQIKKEG